MDHLSSNEIIEQLDMITASLELNEDTYYIVLDLIYQARDELLRTSVEDEDEQ